MTNVRFTGDDSLLVSTGGADTAIMVWRYGNPNEGPISVCGDSDDSDTDSEEEGGEVVVLSDCWFFCITALLICQYGVFSLAC